MEKSEWITAWTVAPVTAPAAPAVLARDLTLHDTLRCLVSGTGARMYLQNFFSDEPAVIEEAADGTSGASVRNTVEEKVSIVK